MVLDFFTFLVLQLNIDQLNLLFHQNERKNQPN